jgi:hypothetical protein
MTPDARRNAAYLLFGLSVSALVGGLYFLAVRYVGPAPNYVRFALKGEALELEAEVSEEVERDAQIRATVRKIRLDAEPYLRFGTPEEKALAQRGLEAAAEVEAERDREAQRLRELQQEVAAAREFRERVARRRTLLFGVGLTLLAAGFFALGLRQRAIANLARTPPDRPA